MAFGVEPLASKCTSTSFRFWVCAAHAAKRTGFFEVVVALVIHHRLVLRREVGEDVHAGGVVPDEEATGRSRFWGPLITDVAAVFILAFLLAFAWEYLKHSVGSYPKISFGATTNQYTIVVPSKQMPVVDPSKAGAISDFRPSYAVLFTNGSRLVDSEEKAKLSLIARVAVKCEALVSVEGYASSRQFKVDSNTRNLALANDTAEAVSAVFIKNGLPTKNMTTTKWQPSDYANMRKGADIDDSRESTAASDLERLNRRVMLNVHFVKMPCLVSRDF
jgi:outer membrane protein OmpA-like peptidoglycan-associated protein